MQKTVANVSTEIKSTTTDGASFCSSPFGAPFVTVSTGPDGVQNEASPSMATLGGKPASLSTGARGTSQYSPPPNEESDGRPGGRRTAIYTGMSMETSGYESSAEDLGGILPPSGTTSTAATGEGSLNLKPVHPELGSGDRRYETWAVAPIRQLPLPAGTQASSHSAAISRVISEFNSHMTREAQEKSAAATEASLFGSNSGGRGELQTSTEQTQSSGRRSSLDRTRAEGQVVPDAVHHLYERLQVSVRIGFSLT